MARAGVLSLPRFPKRKASSFPLALPLRDSDKDRVPSHAYQTLPSAVAEDRENKLRRETS